MTIKDLIYVATPKSHIYIAGTGCDFTVADLLPTLNYVPEITIVTLEADDLRSFYVDTNDNYIVARIFLDITYHNGGCTFGEYLEMEQVIKENFVHI